MTNDEFSNLISSKKYGPRIVPALFEILCEEQSVEESATAHGIDPEWLSQEVAALQKV